MTPDQMTSIAAALGPYLGGAVILLVLLNQIAARVLGGGRVRDLQSKTAVSLSAISSAAERLTVAVEAMAPMAAEVAVLKKVLVAYTQDGDPCRRTCGAARSMTDSGRELSTPQTVRVGDGG